MDLSDMSDEDPREGQDTAPGEDLCALCGVLLREDEPVVCDDCVDIDEEVSW